MVVKDRFSSRYSTVVFRVYGLPAGVPYVRVNKETAGMGDEDDLDGSKLKIKATIEAPPFDDTISSIIRGSISWSVNDETGLDLSANALTRINRNILISEAKPQMVTYLVIKPNSLNGLHDYTFTLTYSSTIHNYTASSSITVRANSPPSMGQVDVIPVKGEELETVFEIGAYLWEDNDLPLTYEPYIRDPYDLANVIVLQTRSEMTSVSRLSCRQATARTQMRKVQPQTIH